MSFDFNIALTGIGPHSNTKLSSNMNSIQMALYADNGSGKSFISKSFKASLSLALGLSDEIQASAGGVKLDTMFVDEGFGSLDEESLDQAMKALSSLADGNRLVGIISHVADLKNRVDKQIVVEKEKSGGSKACIVL